MSAVRKSKLSAKAEQVPAVRFENDVAVADENPVAAPVAEAKAPARKISEVLVRIDDATKKIGAIHSEVAGDFTLTDAQKNFIAKVKLLPDGKLRVIPKAIVKSELTGEEVNSVATCADLPSALKRVACVIRNLAEHYGKKHQFIDVNA